jgi:hypothetical protein
VVRPQLGVAAPSTLGTDGEEARSEWIDEEKAWPAWEEGRRWTQRGLTPASRGLEQATMAAACGRDETPRRRRCRSRGASSGLVVVSQLRQWRVSGRGRPMVDRGRWQCVGEPAVPTARGDAARRGVERLQPGRAGARLGDIGGAARVRGEGRMDGRRRSSVHEPGHRWRPSGRLRLESSRRDGGRWFVV